MIRFNSKIGAIVLSLLAGVYMLLTLFTGHSAQGKAPVDLSIDPLKHQLDVWKTTSLLIGKQGEVAVMDIRTLADFKRYHIPGSINIPQGKLKAIKNAMEKSRSIIFIAENDKEAEKLIIDLLPDRAGRELYYLKDGIRAWYLNMVLPVPLFNEKEPPFGYTKAMQTLNEYFSETSGKDKEKALAALSTLAGLNYEPVLLQRSGKAKPTGKKKKKIVGGCG